MGTSLPTEENYETTSYSRVTTTSPLSLCHTEIDTIHCPEQCHLNTFCNGTHCVDKAQCPCIIGNELVKQYQFGKNEHCQLCKCQGDSVFCSEDVQTCSTHTCQDDNSTSFLNTSTCDCDCLNCKHDEFMCSDFKCISKDLLCDGVRDCNDDEDNCNQTALPTFSTMPTTSMTSTTHAPLSECKPQPVNSNETINMLKITRYSFDGVSSTQVTCTNRQPLDGLMTCLGSCRSGTNLNEMGQLINNCKCCQANDTSVTRITLSCSDGSSFTHSYNQIESCKCMACNGND